MLAFLKKCWKSTVSMKAPMTINNIDLMEVPGATPMSPVWIMI
jgi:hypothetical protein